MSAKITVERGGNRGGQYWIEAEVSKIGSGPDCTFIVPGTPAHCLTLMYRGGQYSVVNRCRQAIDVAGEPLLPTAAAALYAGDTLAIGSGTVLRLDISGDPAPSRPRSPIDSAAAEPPDLVESPQSGATLVFFRCLIVAAGLLAGGYLLFGGPQQSREEMTRDAFAAIIDLLHPTAVEKSSLPARICGAMQDGRTAEIRGNTKQAADDYKKAEKMLANAGQDSGLSAEGRSKAEFYLKIRLAALE
jgi:hypothetical protein